MIEMAGKNGKYFIKRKKPTCTVVVEKIASFLRRHALKLIFFASMDCWPLKYRRFSLAICLQPFNHCP
jgi:hypothetical protein